MLTTIEAPCSKAFLPPPGTTVTVAGEALSEPRSVLLGHTVEMQFNFIPSCKGQRRALDAIVERTPVEIRLFLPGHCSFKWEAVALEGGVTFRRDEIVTLVMRFPVQRLHVITEGISA